VADTATVAPGKFASSADDVASLAIATDASKRRDSSVARGAFAATAGSVAATTIALSTFAASADDAASSDAGANLAIATVAAASHAGYVNIDADRADVLATVDAVANAASYVASTATSPAGGRRERASASSTSTDGGTICPLPQCLPPGRCLQMRRRQSVHAYDVSFNFLRQVR
jgi:hypothetical protein